MHDPSTPVRWTSASGGIVIDEVRPRVTSISFSGVPKLPEFTEYLDELTRRLERQGRFVTILDFTASTGTSMDTTRAQAQWIASQRRRLQRSAGTVLVFPSPTFRFALATLLTATPIPGRYRVVGTHGEALEVAADLLAASQ
jgi:hypothetical protein